MRSLPDIFKRGMLPLSNEVIEIPDFAWPQLEPSEEDIEQTELEDDEEDGEAEPNPEAEFHEFGTPPPPTTEQVHKKKHRKAKAVVPPPRELTPDEIEEIYHDELAQLREKTMKDAIESAQAQIEKEKARVCVQARAEAYDAAISSKAHELEEAIDDVDEKLNELQTQHVQYIEQFTESLKYMAIAIAEKIMMLKIDEDDAVLEKLVLQTLAAIKHAEWISVDISDRLVGLAEFMQEELQKPKYEDKAELKISSSPKDTCRISTETGTIDASIHTQIENLKEAFENAEHS